MDTSSLASVHATRDVLARFGLDSKKALGQHFLIDNGVLSRIIKIAAIQPQDTLLEVGPGIGTLTVELLSCAQAVIAIERDRDLPAVLHETCAHDSDKLILIEEDACKVTAKDISSLCTNAGIGLPRMMVANLPYAVAATIVLEYFEQFEFLQTAVVMVQAEVANRMSASPGTKDYGAYTVKLQLHAQIATRFEVSAGCFYPPPRVESTVVRLERAQPYYLGEPASPELIRAACKAADAAFTQRRKTIRNSFCAYFASRGLEKKSVESLLEAAGVSFQVRGETLVLEDFLRLGDALLQAGLS